MNILTLCVISYIHIFFIYQLIEYVKQLIQYEKKIYITLKIQFLQLVYKIVYKIRNRCHTGLRKTIKIDVKQRKSHFW